MDEEPDIIEQDEPIYDLAVECERLFEEHIARLNEEEDANGAAIISELSHGFSTWATFLGVFLDENMCLDRRLRHHGEIQDQVLRVLDLMVGNLAYVLEPDADTDGASEQIDVRSSAPAQQLSLSIENVEAVSEAIDRLNKYGIVIRQSSMTGQARKAREFTETFDLTSFEEFSYLCVKALYPAASEELLDQLTNSMTDTYKMFLYQKSKRQIQPRPRVRTRLPMVVIEEDSSEDEEPVEPMDFEMDISGPNRNTRPNRSRTPIPLRQHFLAPHSKPTTMDSLEVKTRLRKIQHPSKKGKTVSVLVSQVDYPRPVENKNICDWCFSPLPLDIFEGDNWQQHVNEDHRPFICISEKCLKVSPSPRFASSRKWLEHMLAAHGQHWHREVHAPSQWICPLCNDSKATFLTADDLTTHLSDHHENRFTDAQIKAIVRQSRTRYPRPQDVCPVCCLSMDGEKDSAPRSQSTRQEDKISGAPHQPDKLESSQKRLKTPMGHASLDSRMEGHGHPAPIEQQQQSKSGAEAPPNANLTVEFVSSHIAGHLRTIMLLTLRIISTDVAVEVSSDKESMSGSTDNQLSQVPTSHEALDPETELLDKLLLGQFDELGIDHDSPVQEDIPDSEEFFNWDMMRPGEGDPLTDDFLRQAMENGAFQSHLENDTDFELSSSEGRTRTSSRRSSQHSAALLEPAAPAAMQASATSARQLSHQSSSQKPGWRRTPSPSQSQPEDTGIIQPSTPPLRRVDRQISGDLRALHQQDQDYPTPVANEGRVRATDMTDVYESYGEGRIGSPRSPTRPQSMRRRQSMQVIELESKVEQLLAENRALSEARANTESSLTQRVAAALADRDAENDALKQSLKSLQNEVARLTDVNNGLTSANAELVDKDTAAEIAELRSQLEASKERIRDMQRQILESKASESYLQIRDEDYFDDCCTHLCSHIQQWVMRFSKFSDMRACRLTNEINDDKMIDRLDNAILDGSDVDIYLSDRIRRQNVFMSIVSNMMWEFIFTRYMFGLDREQRQRLKVIEKLLVEVGPAEAVRQWRALTLTLLSRRESFQRQRDLDTEAVVQTIFETLCKTLPPPSNLEDQVQTQLRRIIKEAVGLSIEMRTQKPEYMMLPPLQPEYDENGDLVGTVRFNASLMNERSGSVDLTNEELEARGAVVRIILFPLVVKKGDDDGRGDDEVVICPLQVLIARSSIGGGITKKVDQPEAEHN